MKVAVLAVGNEILMGKTVDTNGAAASREIDLLGGVVVHREVVTDSIEDIVNGLRHSFEYADVVIIIGGLGPTVDDLTRDGVAKYFDEPLIKDETIAQNLSDFFKSRKRVMTDNNLRQAFVFESGKVLDNPHGTAPGLFLEKADKRIYLLPGPPNEFYPMLYNFVLPDIKKLVATPQVMRSYRLYSIGESPAETLILPLYEKYPMLHIAPYASISYVDYMVRVDLRHERFLDAFEQDFMQVLSEYYVGSADKSLATRLVEIMTQRSLTLALAESCTGGMVASSFVDVPGSSKVLLEGIVTYSNEAKQKYLGVTKETLAEHGAVSEECAREMVTGVQKAAGVDVAIATTGIAGPDGGTEEKPVGTVYIAIAVGEKVIVERQNFRGDRTRIRERTMNEAHYMLFKALQK